MKREFYEWIHSWCDETPKDDLPRVLLVGDSITYGYQELVREALRGVCYVDYVATSYAVDNKLYHALVEGMAKNCHYDIVHINHGLHGIHNSPRTYKSKLKNLLVRLQKDSKLILAETTFVYNAGNKRPHRAWMKRVKERNEILGELATELDADLDRLFAISEKMPKEYRREDGTHFEKEGYQVLAEAVCKSIKANL